MIVDGQKASQRAAGGRGFCERLGILEVFKGSSGGVDPIIGVGAGNIGDGQHRYEQETKDNDILFRQFS